MNHDFKESLMIIANKDITQYNEIKRLSITEFLTRYELIIADIETAN